MFLDVIGSEHAAADASSASSRCSSIVVGGLTFCVCFVYCNQAEAEMNKRLEERGPMELEGQIPFKI